MSAHRDSCTSCRTRLPECYTMLERSTTSVFITEKHILHRFTDIIQKYLKHKTNIQINQMGYVIHLKILPEIHHHPRPTVFMGYAYRMQ